MNLNNNNNVQNKIKIHNLCNNSNSQPPISSVQPKCSCHEFRTQKIISETSLSGGPLHQISSAKKPKIENKVWGKGKEGRQFSIRILSDASYSICSHLPKAEMRSVISIIINLSMYD